MKYKILLKSLFLFTLILTFSSVVYASEVTGILSSTGITSESTSASSSEGGTLSGTVIGINTGSSSSSGSFMQSTGSVLGASTVRENPQTVVSSPNNTDLGVSSNDINPNSATDESSITPIPSPVLASNQTTTELGSSQTASALGASGGLTFSGWFWILFILLLLIITAIYIYNRSYVSKKKSTHI